MSGFLTAGIVVAFLAGIAAYFFQMPALSLGSFVCIHFINEWSYTLRNKQYYSWRRNQLHHGNGYSIHFYLQLIPEPSSPIRCVFWR